MNAEKMKNRNKQVIQAVAIIAIIGVIWYLEVSKPNHLADGAGDVMVASVASTTTSNASTGMDHMMAGGVNMPPLLTLAQKEAEYPRAKELSDPTGFINTAPFKLSDIAGKKVILIDFWTYSCINCLRTVPYLKAW